MPTAIVNWQLELAVEFRRRPLRSRAGKEEYEEKEDEQKEKEEEEEQPLIF